MKERPQETGLPVDTAPLDPKIALIVKKLNKSGYTTWNSCQGGRGHGVLVGLIEFDAEKFGAADKCIISSIITHFTQVPFKFATFSGFARVVFERPL